MLWLHLKQMPKEVIYKLELNGSCKVVKQMDISKCMGVKEFKFEHSDICALLQDVTTSKTLMVLGLRGLMLLFSDTQGKFEN